MKAARFALVPLGLFLLGGCARTEVADTWMRPDYAPVPSTKTLVLGIAESDEIRDAFESEVVKRLVDRGRTAETGLAALPPRAWDLPREELKAKVMELGFDSVIVMALVERKYVPQNPPGGYSAQSFGTMYTNYPTKYGHLENPVPDDEKELFVLEARYYVLDSKGVVWRIETETKEPKDMDSFAEEFAEIVVDRLERDGLLGP